MVLCESTSKTMTTFQALPRKPWLEKDRISASNESLEEAACLLLSVKNVKVHTYKTGTLYLLVIIFALQKTTHHQTGKILVTVTVTRSWSRDVFFQQHLVISGEALMAVCGLACMSASWHTFRKGRWPRKITNLSNPQCIETHRNRWIVTPATSTQLNFCETTITRPDSMANTWWTNAWWIRRPCPPRRNWPARMNMWLKSSWTWCANAWSRICSPTHYDVHSLVYCSFISASWCPCFVAPLPSRVRTCQRCPLRLSADQQAFSSTQCSGEDCNAAASNEVKTQYQQKKS